MGDKISILENFIEQGLERGFSLDTLKEKLLEKGWKKLEIEEAMKKCPQTKETPKIVEQKKETTTIIEPKKEIPKIGETENTSKTILEDPLKNEISSSITNNSKNPSSLKISSIIYYLQTILLILIPIYILFFGATIFGESGRFIKEMIFNLQIFILLPFATLFFFIAKGLEKFKKWAKIFAIIFSVIGLAAGIIQTIEKILQEGIPLILANVYILWTLIFNKKVKKIFSKKIN